MKFVAIIISAVLALFGFAGGGGSDSGGGGSDFGGSSSWSSSDSDYTSEGGDIWILIVAVTIVVVAVFLDKLASRRRISKRDIAVMNANSHESPQEKNIREQAEQIFRTYQDDWSNFNFQNISSYTTPEYYQHASLMLELLQSMHRVNKVSQLSVEGAYVMASVKDDTPLPVNLRVKIYFSGLDEVIDTQTSDILYSDFAKNIHETWSFIYDGKSLKLAGISQPTESASHLVRSLADFASQNKLFYSPDWGRHALPTRGLIFSNASIKTSDVNNHIIGKWGDLLIQIYTYSEIPGDPSTYYLVGQISLPKSYKGVIVKSKQSKSKVYRRIDKSYEKFELEWPDFNKRYEVYAASADALPAFELLNPKFMELLYGKNPEYSLEVADNSIYIFMNNKQATEQDYADLLDVLSAAYQELKQ